MNDYTNETMKDESRLYYEEGIRNAKWATKEIVENCDYLYSDHYRYNGGYFSDWNDFFFDWYENNDKNKERPIFVWATAPMAMFVDAEWIIEQSVGDELYETFRNSIPDSKVEEFQAYINQWFEDCGARYTYTIDRRYKIKIPWKEYKRESYEY